MQDEFAPEEFMLDEEGEDELEGESGEGADEDEEDS